jgi:hypothetical protein
VFATVLLPQRIDSYGQLHSRTHYAAEGPAVVASLSYYDFMNLRQQRPEINDAVQPYVKESVGRELHESHWFYFTIESAANLVAKDAATLETAGSSDPYVVAFLNDVQIAKTEVRYDTLNPCWSHSFCFARRESFHALEDVTVRKWGKKVFSRMDVDHNGVLSSKELSQQLIPLLRRMRRDHATQSTKFSSVEEMIHALDEDGDGSVSLDEWLDRLSDCPQLAQALVAPEQNKLLRFEVYDHDSFGQEFIGHAELDLHELLTSPQRQGSKLSTSAYSVRSLESIAETSNYRVGDLDYEPTREDIEVEVDLLEKNSETPNGGTLKLTVSNTCPWSEKDDLEHHPLLQKEVDRRKAKAELRAVHGSDTDAVLEGIEGRMNHVEQRLEKMDERLGTMDNKLERILLAVAS